MGLRQGRIPLSLFVSREGWPVDLGLGLACGGGLVLAWRGLSRVAEPARRLESRLAELVASLSVTEAVGLALLSGLAEELLFRGAIQPAWGFWPATILFALLHTGRERVLWWWTVSAFLAGALFGLLFAWRGNLTAPIVAHVLVNALQLPRLLAGGPDDARTPTRPC